MNPVEQNGKIVLGFNMVEESPHTDIARLCDLLGRGLPESFFEKQVRSSPAYLLESIIRRHISFVCPDSFCSFAHPFSPLNNHY
jgi:hypothetical protein